MGFNGIGSYTLNAGGHAVVVGISFGGNDVGGPVRRRRSLQSVARRR
jgi:hypothetical protein